MKQSLLQSSCTNPKSQPKVVGLLCEHYNVPAVEVSKQLELQGEQRVTMLTLNFLASGVVADFAIDEILLVI